MKVYGVLIFLSECGCNGENDIVLKYGNEYCAVIFNAYCILLHVCGVDKTPSGGKTKKHRPS